MDPIHWFLDGKNDVRSSYYLEDVATEFHVQGLELDWVYVAKMLCGVFGMVSSGTFGRETTIVAVVTG